MKPNIEKLILITTLLIAVYLPVKAQTTIDVEFRPRSEFREGFRRPLADTLNPALITTQRTRLSLNSKSGILNTQLTIQDARVWGQNDPKVNTSKLELFEAWAEMLLLPGFSATVGRQALKYDDQRIFGPSNWSPTGQAHDLALFRYRTSRFQAHLGLAFSNPKDTLLEITYPFKQYRTLAFTWLSYDFGKGLNASAITVNEGLQKSSDYSKTYYRNTVGMNLLLANESAALNFNLGGYYQFGKSNAYDTAKVAKNITYTDLNAFMVTGKISLRLFDPLQIFAATDIYSGTDYSVYDKTNTFNKLYGTNHSLNGYMEYWTILPKAGLKDYYFGILPKASKNLSFELIYHIFSFYSDFQYTYPNKTKEVLTHDLGSEADFTILYKLSKETSIQAGYSYFFTNSNTEKVLKTYGSPNHPAQWAYIMFTIRPVLYKSPEIKLN